MVKYALLPLVAVSLVQAGGPEWHHSRTADFAVDSRVHKGCTSWINIVDASGKLTCDAFLDTINVAKRQFIFWNPQLNSDCSNLKSKASYCAFLPSHASKQTRGQMDPPPKTKPLPPGWFNDWGNNGAQKRSDPPPKKRDDPSTTKWLEGFHGPKEAPPPGWGHKGVVEGNHGDTMSTRSPIMGTGLSEQQSEPAFMPPHIPNLPNGMENRMVVHPTTLTKKLRPTGSYVKRDANAPAPTPSSVGVAIAGCKQYHTVKAKDTCFDVAQQYPGLLFSEFLRLNPNLDTVCPNLKANTRVCVKGDPKTNLVPTPSAVVGVHARNIQGWPSPTKPGTNPGCKTFEKVKKGDSCEGVARKHHISVAQLKKWNPAVGPTCEKLEIGYYVCVRV
ncbi:LysM domain-containing protein [Trichophyton interdigitale]|nr:LysM domain-containing protein [Trichophyton interdigitale]KAG5216881.1 LysM domain-containing protein [Trichophyton interdigitale]KAG8205807.1 LysM domain-containing protein [Trichophyton interdigitale]